MHCKITMGLNSKQVLPPFFNVILQYNFQAMAIKGKENPFIVAYQIERNKVWFELYGVFFCEKETEQGGKMCDQQCEGCERHYTDKLK